MKKFFIIFTVIILSSLSIAAYFQPDVRPGKGVTGFGWLSDYHEGLKGTNLDTPVYFMDSGEEGATFLLMGGTHSNEISTMMTATMFIERAVVKKGIVIVIPYSNKSGVSVNDTRNPNIDHFLPIETKSGPRFIVYGDRRTDPEDQIYPDPEIFKHYQSDFTLEDGAEARNLNRQYPGVADGNITQQLAYAIIQLIKEEGVNINLDMHESDPPGFTYQNSNGSTYSSGRLAYMLVCNPAEISMEIGAIASMEIEMYDLPIKLDQSNPAFRGLSHLEIGNYTDSLSFLSESPNPGMSQQEFPDVLYDEDFPLKHRIGWNLTVISSLIDGYNMMFGDSLEIDNLPDYFEIMDNGFEEYLN